MNMFLEIVTPEASIFQGDVNSIIVPGVIGEFQMLNSHAPIVSLLQEGKVKIRGNFTIDEAYQSKFSKGENDHSELSINSGTIELKENKIIILVD
jgi:F-type H+-transporting ATPase subunit epsilon